MKTRNLSDGDLLWLAISLEDQCARRFMEMADAFDYVDDVRARTFREMAGDELAHRECLIEEWRALDAPQLPHDETQRWLEHEFACATEIWDREDANAPRALSRVQAIENAAIAFYSTAEVIARHSEVGSLFHAIRELEAQHAGDVE